MFKINPSVYAEMTAIPSAIISNHIKVSSAYQLRVILALFSSPSDINDTEKLAKLSGVPETEIGDCLAYWSERGVLTSDRQEQEEDTDTEPAAATQKNEIKTEQKSHTEIKIPEKTPEEELKPSLPTRAQVAQRLMECAELRDLLFDVQKILKRTLGNNDNAVIVLLHDYYGSKPEILLAICEYARLNGKANNMTFIKSMAINWSKREIETIDLANAEIERLEKSGEHWKTVLKATGNAFSVTPTESQRETAEKWIVEWHFTQEMIALAFEEMQNNNVKPNIKYMNAILAKWFTAGVNTPEKAEKHKQNFEDKKIDSAGIKKRPSNDNKPDANSGASYDINKAKEEAEKGEIKFRKRKK